MELKAVPTNYKGYRFRSRLEARIAVFLDACNADWEYEPEGFVLPDGSQYLPDFKVNNVKGRVKGTLYIEAKGVMADKDFRKIQMFTGNYCPRTPPDRFACDRCPLGKQCVYRQISGERLLIVGSIPDPEDYRGYICDYAYNNPGPFVEYYYNFYFIDGDWFHAIPCVDRSGGLHIDDENYNYFDGVDEGLTANAYRMARQARFEYGETPDGRINTGYDFDRLDKIPYEGGL